MGGLSTEEALDFEGSGLLDRLTGRASWDADLCLDRGLAVAVGGSGFRRMGGDWVDEAGLEVVVGYL
jgi:hypothetical protein